MLRIFNQVKKIIPKISDTELIALRSGTTSLDRQIFQGKVIYPSKKDYTKSWETDFKHQQVNQLLSKYGNEDKLYPNSKFPEILDYLGKNKYFS